MKTEEIIDRLRNPQKYRKETAASRPHSPEEIEIVASKTHANSLVFPFLIALGVLAMAAAILLITLHTKNRAEDLSASLNPNQLQGLTANTEFDPRKIVTYVNINELGEGGDRVPTVEELGSTIPIISRYNYQAITAENYGIIGAAPWALSSNIEANLKDVDLLRYLLNRPEVANAFVQRPDAAALLTDPQLLGSFAQDNTSLQEFFTSPLVQHILANEDLVMAFSKSRLMSMLLTSKAVKFYRDRPQEFARIIHTSPILAPLTKNPHIRKAVQENFYLKTIATQLLDNVAPAPVKPVAKAASTEIMDETDEEYEEEAEG